MSKQKLINNAGMTLVEVVLAMAMLAVISIPLLRYFTDSMNTSVGTEYEQKATVKAQTVAEELLSQEALIELDSSTNNYKISYLESAGYTSNAATSAASDFVTTGKGVITYEKTEAGEFKTVVTVNSATKFNNDEHPIIDCIDGKHDVDISEKNQLDEAVMYFMSLNDSAHRSDSSIPLLADQNDCKSKMSRDIIVDIGLTNPTGSVSNNYEVKVSYRYHCYGISSNGDDTFTVGVSSQKLNYKSDTKINMLNRILIMFDIYEYTDSSNKKCFVYDKLYVNDNTGIANFKPQICLINQNENVIATSDYNMKTDTDLEVASNLSATMLRGISVSSAKTFKSLTGTAQTIRTIDYTVNVYCEKDVYGIKKGDLVASYTSSKGE